MSAILNTICDVLLWPFEQMHPLLGITLVSLVIGVLMVLVFKWTSNQEGIQRAKDRMKAYRYAILIFKDDLSILGKSIFQIFRHLAVYQGYFLKPILVAIVPLMLLLFQLDSRFSHDAFEPGQTIVLKVGLKKGVAPDAELVAPPGLAVEAKVRLADRYPKDESKNDEGEVAWRLRPEQVGDFELKIRSGGQEETKRLVVGEKTRQMAPLRSAGFFTALLYPAEPPLSSESPFESIELVYPDLSLGLISGGSGMVLLIVFILSMVFGFMVKGLFKVDF